MMLRFILLNTSFKKLLTYMEKNAKSDFCGLLKIKSGYSVPIFPMTYTLQFAPVPTSYFHSPGGGAWTSIIWWAGIYSFSYWNHVPIVLKRIPSSTPSPTTLSCVESIPGCPCGLVLTIRDWPSWPCVFYEVTQKAGGQMGPVRSGATETLTYQPYVKTSPCCHLIKHVTVVKDIMPPTL